MTPADPTREGLRPCPFCGGEAALERSFAGGPYVLCGDCGAATMYAKVEAEAIAAWNRRPTPTADDALVERCVAFVDDQSQGEWTDKIIREDAAKMAAFVRSEIAVAALPDDRTRAMLDAAVEGLREARDQLAFLDVRMPCGSTPDIIGRVERALRAIEGSRA